MKQHIFHENPVDNFVNYLLLPRNNFSKIVCLSHNAQGFDSLKSLVNINNIPKIMMRGSKMLSLISDKSLSYSLIYFPIPLSKLAAAFDLPGI